MSNEPDDFFDFFVDSLGYLTLGLGALVFLPIWFPFYIIYKLIEWKPAQRYHGP